MFGIEKLRKEIEDLNCRINQKIDFVKFRVDIIYDFYTKEAQSPRYQKLHTVYNAIYELEKIKDTATISDLNRIFSNGNIIDGNAYFGALGELRFLYWRYFSETNRPLNESKNYLNNDQVVKYIIKDMIQYLKSLAEKIFVNG